MTSNLYMQFCICSFELQLNYVPANVSHYYGDTFIIVVNKVCIDSIAFLGPHLLSRISLYTFVVFVVQQLHNHRN